MNAISHPPGIILTPSGRSAALEALENNWYEGSRWSPNRSFIWFPVQDAKRDLDRFTRLELSRKARYLYKNSCLIRGLIERLVTLTVGSGFYPVFKSSNPKWNARAKEVWRRKSRNISLGPRASFSQYTRAICRARFIDGEAFSVKTMDDTIAFESRIQGLESDRIAGTRGKGVGNPTTAEFSNNYGGGVDGMNLNSQGIVVSYNIRGVDEPYPADAIIHHYTPGRLGQMHGESILAAAINTASDVDDILGLEKQAVKDASSKQDVIETSSGQLDAEQFRNLRYGNQYPTVFNLPPDENTKDDYYRVQFGGKPVVLKRGDKFTPYKPDRPGSAWQGFMDFLSMTICLSSSMPPSVILPIATGGTDIRRDNEIAQRVVDPWQMDIAAELDEMLQYLLTDEIYDGSLRQDLPEDWNVIGWQFPQKLNVDRQQAQQDREDVAHGLMSREEYHGRYGEDASVIDSTIIKEVKTRKEAILAAGFVDAREFVEVMSLDSKMFQIKVMETVEGDTGDDTPAGQQKSGPQPKGKPV